MREEIAVVSATKSFDEGNPGFCVCLKFHNFVRIYFILNIASNHDISNSQFVFILLYGLQSFFNVYTE